MQRNVHLIFVVSCSILKRRQIIYYYRYGNTWNGKLWQGISFRRLLLQGNWVKKSNIIVNKLQLFNRLFLQVICTDKWNNKLQVTSIYIPLISFWYLYWVKKDLAFNSIVISNSYWKSIIVWLKINGKKCWDENSTQ